MFWRRLLSSVILMAITITLIVISEIPLILGLGVISIIGLMELYRVLGFHRTPLAYLCYVLAAVYEVCIYTSGLTLGLAMAFASMLAIMILYVFAYPRYSAKEIMGAFFGLVYVVFMLSFIFLVRILDKGQYLVWLIFIAAWGNDTLAYCAGMAFGKHKMSPELSPKKSVEGFIGGVVGAALLGFVYALIFKEQLGAAFSNPLVMVPILTAIGGAVSVVGDLTASGIKRNYDIKDYGTLIPGHGGILDRFDSIIVTAPAVFFVIMFFSVVG